MARRKSMNAGQTALLGAAYGLVKSRGELSRPAQSLLASAQRSPVLYSSALSGGFRALAGR